MLGDGNQEKALIRHPLTHRDRTIVPMSSLVPGLRGVELCVARHAVTICPACGSSDHRTFFEQADIPIDSCRLVNEQEEAKSFPRGELHLALCERCGFIWNKAFDPSLQYYSAVFEETQWLSERFQTFGSTLVDHLIQTYGLRDKDVLEIGCGPGHFLDLLCRKGNNRGIGLDPHYVDLSGTTSPRVRIIREYFSEKHSALVGDLIVCRHTLEHIQPVGDLLRLIRSTLPERTDTVVFFEVPDMLRVLYDGAFWQLYYEHCSYFTAGSLARLYRATGLEVLNLRSGFGSQILLIEGRATGHGGDGLVFEEEETVAQTCCAVRRFVETFDAKRSDWLRTFELASHSDLRIVLWGATSQSVAFTLALGIENVIAYIVNINPKLHGKFAVGTGQQVVAPDFLREYQPDLVIAMNPIYREEIARSLIEIGVSAKLITVCDNSPQEAIGGA